VAIPLSEASYTKSNYFKRDFGYTNFMRILDFLKKYQPPLVNYKSGFIDYETKNGRVSRFIPSQHLLDLLNGYVHLFVLPKPGAKLTTPNLMEEALAYSKSHPFKRIAISQSATRYREASDCIRLKDSEKRLKPFRDTAEIRQMRKDLEKWNDFLEKHHHVDLLLPDAEIENLYEREHEDEELEAFWSDERDRPKFVELERVRLYRVFNNGSFNEGGRFYGGWWQNVASEYRQFITINGHTTSEYDYSSLHPAMLYAEAGLPLGEDAYEIEGIELTKHNRKLIKTTFLKLINARRGQRIDRPRDKALPKGWTWEALQEAIIKKHEVIKDHFRSGVGLKLQKRDAEIAKTVMLRMMKRDILVLPVHDSFITYHELRNDLEKEMRRAYKEQVGKDIAIKADESLRDRYVRELDGFQLDPEEVVENIMERPGYEGYRERSREFFRTRTDRWWRRFDRGEE
jgi:hypothetical protein